MVTKSLEQLTRPGRENSQKLQPYLGFKSDSPRAEYCCFVKWLFGKVTGQGPDKYATGWSLNGGKNAAHGLVADMAMVALSVMHVFTKELHTKTIGTYNTQKVFFEPVGLRE